MIQDNLREELIKQFPSEVILVEEEPGKEYYACPTCKRAIAKGTTKCSGCSQALSWDHIRREEMVHGASKASLEFEVPSDFAPGDCRKCPLSYIAKENHENVYECPLKMRTNCKLKIS